MWPTRRSRACPCVRGSCRSRCSFPWAARFAPTRTKWRPIRARAAQCCGWRKEPAWCGRDRASQLPVACPAGGLRPGAGHLAPPDAEAVHRVGTRAGTVARLRCRVGTVATGTIDLGHAGADREDRARTVAHAGAAGESDPDRGAREAMRAKATTLAVPRFPAWRALALFALLAAGLGALAARSLYLQ